jgi:membrane fusion protein, multidrug efflux system
MTKGFEMTGADSSPSAGGRPAPPPWTPSHRPSRRAGTFLYIGGGIVVVAAIGAVIALSAFKRTSVSHEQQVRVSAVAKGPTVRVVHVERSPGSRTIILSGETRPFLSVALYAKVSGYLKDVRVDKGDHVKAGDLLAVVQSPETDQQVEAAIADARNKRAIADRDGQLIAQKLIAPEESEQAETNSQMAAATVERFKALKDYELIRAPFSGTVTARYADPGALVQNAEGSQTSALPVVEIGTTDSLRIFVYLAQRDAADIRRGAPATITDPSRPDVHVTGTVTRYTGELDPNTRTLLAEIDLSNRNGAIVPGSFVQVSLAVPGRRYLEVPAEALIVRGPKTYVAVITSDDRVAFRQVHVLDTDGVTVRLLDGVQEGDRVGLNLGDSVPEGQHVQPVGDTAEVRSVS